MERIKIRREVDPPIPRMAIAKTERCDFCQESKLKQRRTERRISSIPTQEKSESGHLLGVEIDV
jgi:hypothetical protein